MQEKRILTLKLSAAADELQQPFLYLLNELELTDEELWIINLKSKICPVSKNGKRGVVYAFLPTFNNTGFTHRVINA